MLRVGGRVRTGDAVRARAAARCPARLSAPPWPRPRSPAVGRHARDAPHGSRCVRFARPPTSTGRLRRRAWPRARCCRPSATAVRPRCSHARRHARGRRQRARRRQSRLPASNARCRTGAGIGAIHPRAARRHARWEADADERRVFTGEDAPPLDARAGDLRRELVEAPRAACRPPASCTATLPAAGRRSGTGADAGGVRCGSTARRSPSATRSSRPRRSGTSRSTRWKGTGDADWRGVPRGR